MGIQKTCAPNGCAYTANGCQMKKSATDIVTNFAKNGYHIAVRSITKEPVYGGMPKALVVPGIMTVEGFTPLDENKQPITFRDHLRGAKAIPGGQVVFEYANLEP